MMHQTLLTAVPVLATFVTFGQCTFTPTIVPNDPLQTVLCPNDMLVLSTQAYDSYQWYRSGVAIPGGDQQSLALYDQQQDWEHTYTVMAELDGCFAMSPGVHVTPFTSFAPFVIIENGNYQLDNGVLIYCEGDHVELTLGMPYTGNIVWMNGQQPIAGANEQSLVVTGPGSYTVMSAHEQCPNSTFGMFLPIQIAFMPNVQPVITMENGVLCAAPAGNAHTWYLNNVPIPGSDTPCIDHDASGVYTVYADYGLACQMVSEPFITTGSATPLRSSRPTIHPNPSTGLIHVELMSPLPTGSKWIVLDLSGRAVRNGAISAAGPLVLDLQDMATGSYLFQVYSGNTLLAPAMRFEVAH